MPQYGLRTEIIVNLCILVGAALLFSGFLLLCLLERELVRSHVHGFRQQLIMAARLAESIRGQDQAAIHHAFAGAATRWVLVDADLNTMAADPPATSPPRPEDLRFAHYNNEPLTCLEYSSFYLPYGEHAAAAVVITVPLHSERKFVGALQGSFSLLAVNEAMAEASRFFFFFLLLYGGVLLLFGFWLLGKTVVRPVRGLTVATARIAEGNLTPILVPAGPHEITELARSFNRMTDALRESRLQTEHSIASLRQANDSLRQTQDELLRSERLASVGHLAAGMAHEIGNPLGAIIGYLELLRAELPPGRDREIVVYAAVEAARIDRLVRELLDYARPDTSEAAPSDPAAVLAEAVELLTHQGVLAGLEIDNRMPAVLPKVGLGRHKLLQVFINLLVNAVDALCAGESAEKRRSIRLKGGGDSGEIWISVADNGRGIEPAVLPHIFDPFFTTKATGVGRGLGLAVCHRLITESGGRIEVVANGGGGSTFILRLRPAAAEAA